MAKQPLVETAAIAFEILEEATEKNKHVMKVKGIFASADEINNNNRVYPEAIQDREIEKLKPLMEDRSIFSEADHPEDGKSRIRNVAAIPVGIEKKKIDSRTVYIGEAILLNTEQGKNIQEIIRAGGKVGVSQRGWGSLSPGKWEGKQCEIVEADYTLKTFDFVIGQSTKGAEVELIETIIDADRLEAEALLGDSFQGQRNKLLQKLKEGFREVKILRTYPDSVIFETEYGIHRAVYIIEGGMVVLGPDVDEMGAVYVRKDEEPEIVKALRREDARKRRDLEVAGLLPREDFSKDRKEHGDSEFKKLQRRVAGLE